MIDMIEPVKSVEDTSAAGPGPEARLDVNREVGQGDMAGTAQVRDGEFLCN